MPGPWPTLANGEPLPFHPILVNFTAALIPMSFLFDILGAARSNASFRSTAWRLLLCGAVITPLTAAAGWWWWFAGREAHADHWQMPVHQWLGTGISIVVIPIAVWRARLHRTDRRPTLPYALAAAAVLAAMVLQGELGGSMSFGRGVFLHPHEESPAPGEHHD